MEVVEVEKISLLKMVKPAVLVVVVTVILLLDQVEQEIHPL